MAESFQGKRKAGLVQAHGSGYGGSGYKFDATEDDSKKAERKVTTLHCCCARSYPVRDF
jgi:ATP-dependent RNA helicase DDX46/PRP5